MTSQSPKNSPENQTPFDKTYAYLSASAPTTALARMQMALAHLPISTSGRLDLLRTWSSSLGYSPESQMAYEFVMEIGGQRASLRAAGESAVVAPRLTRLLPKLGFTEESLNRLSQLGQELDPSRLGCWLALSEGSADAGWFLPFAAGEMGLRQVRAYTIPSEDEIRLAVWAADHGVDECLSFGHSSGQGNPISELLLTLPGETAQAQLDTGLSAFPELDLPSLPSAVADTLFLGLGDPGLRLSVRLAADGFVSLTLLLPQPPSDLLLRLADPQGEDDEHLAAVQGTLNMDGPSYLGCGLSADGFDVEVRYTITAAPVPPA